MSTHFGCRSAPSDLHDGRDPGTASGSATEQRLPTHLPSLRLTSAAATRTSSPVRASAPAATPTPDNGREEALRTHLATMERFLDVQADVMRAYLAGGAPATADPRTDGAPLTDQATPVEAPTETAETREVAPGGDLAAVVRHLLHERSGYQEEMLHDDLDLEADLGIDSIKHVEDHRRRPARPRLAVLRRTRRPAPGADHPRDRRRAVPGLRRRNRTRPVPQPLPFLDRVVDLVPGQRFVATCTWDQATDGFLRDHTLEHRPPSPADTSLVGLPVVPLTVSMEVCAEAALGCHGAGRVVGMADVAAHRWITVDGTRTVRATAVALADGWYDVRIDDPDTAPGPLVTARVQVAAGDPEPPVAVAPEAPAPPVTSAPYGPDGLFHGPAFQVVRSVDAVSPTAPTRPSPPGAPARSSAPAPAPPPWTPH